MPKWQRILLNAFRAAQRPLETAKRAFRHFHYNWIRGALYDGSASGDIIGRKCGPGVFDYGNELSVKSPKGAGLSPDQVQIVIKMALEKGWTHIYVYTGDGKPDIAAARRIRETMIKMGIPEDKVRCVDVEALYVSKDAAKLPRPPEPVSA